MITTGTPASRAEAVSWVLARIRERPACARLSERHESWTSSKPTSDSCDRH